jgi:hypothetical protein
MQLRLCIRMKIISALIHMVRRKAAAMKTGAGITKINDCNSRTSSVIYGEIYGGAPLATPWRRAGGDENPENLRAIFYIEHAFIFNVKIFIENQLIVKVR